MNKVGTYESIPKDIWLFIFAALELCDLYHVMQVCKWWYSMSLEDVLWKPILTANNIKSDDPPRQVLKYCTTFYLPVLMLPDLTVPNHDRWNDINECITDVKQGRWIKVIAPPDAPMKMLFEHIFKNETFMIEKSNHDLHIEWGDLFRNRHSAPVDDIISVSFDNTVYCVDQIVMSFNNHFCSGIHWHFRRSKSHTSKNITMKWTREKTARVSFEMVLRIICTS